MQKASVGAQGFGTLGPGGLSDVTGHDMRLRLVLLFCSLCCAAVISSMLFLLPACQILQIDMAGVQIVGQTDRDQKERQLDKRTVHAQTAKPALVDNRA